MKIKDTIIILAIVTFMSLFSNVLGTTAARYGRLESGW